MIKLHLLALSSLVETERVGVGDIHGRVVTEEADQEVEVVPTCPSLPISTTWAQVRHVVTGEADGQGGRESRKCWSLSICFPRSTLHPTLPIWTASSRLPCPLTTTWVTLGSTSSISEWEKKTSFRVFLPLLPALCQHRGSSSNCTLHNSSATQVCSRALTGLQ